MSQYRDVPTLKMSDGAPISVPSITSEPYEPESRAWSCSGQRFHVDHLSDTEVHEDG